MAVSIKSEREIALMRESCKILAKVYEELEKAIRPYINLPLFSDAEIEAMTQESKLSYLIKRERRNFCFDKFPQLIEKLKKEN